MTYTTGIIICALAVGNLLLAGFGMGWPDFGTPRGNGKADEMKDILTAFGQIPWTVKASDGSVIKLDQAGIGNMYFVGFLGMGHAGLSSIMLAIFPNNGSASAAVILFMTAASAAFFVCGTSIPDEFKMAPKQDDAVTMNWGSAGALLWICGSINGALGIAALVRVGVLMWQKPRSFDTLSVAVGFIGGSFEISIFTVACGLISKSSRVLSYRGVYGKDRDPFASPLYAIWHLQEYKKVSHFQAQVMPIAGAIFCFAALFAALVDGCVNQSKVPAIVTGVLSTLATMMFVLQYTFLASATEAIRSDFKYHWCWSVFGVALNVSSCLAAVFLSIYHVVQRSKPKPFYCDSTATQEMLEIRAGF